MNSPDTDWRSYHRWNRRDEHLAELWVRKLVKHLRGRDWLGPQSRVLDFGCGYFDVGIGVADRVGRIDGFDPDELTLDVVRQRVKPNSPTELFGAVEAIPRRSYDLIIANSVVQYLGGDGDLARTLALFRDLLRGRGTVLLGDLIPPRYSSALDALRSLWVACRHRMTLAMIVHLWKAAFKGTRLQLYQVAPSRIAELAADAGFACELLRTNVTPSRRRFSCVLTLAR